MRIDHVIYVARDLEPATRALSVQLGFAPSGGGRHVGWGTHNRIFAFGGGYLEVLAVADAQEAAASPIGQAVDARLEAIGEGLWGWAVAVDDVEPFAQRLGLQVRTVERDGLRAQTAGIAEALAGAGLPFFIARDHGIPDPGAGGAYGGISWLEVTGDAERIGEWLGGAQLPLRVVTGDDGVRAFGFGDRELRSR